MAQVDWPSHIASGHAESPPEGLVYKITPLYSETWVGSRSFLLTAPSAFAISPQRLSAIRMEPHGPPKMSEAPSQVRYHDQVVGENLVVPPAWRPPCL